MKQENQSLEQLEQTIDSIKSGVLEITNKYEQEIDTLKKELEQLQEQTKGFVAPDYAMLPVSPQVYEAIMQVAQQRGIAPGVIMAAEPVTNHLLALVNREII